jgi:serine/threonine protein kinase, bacterial
MLGRDDPLVWDGRRISKYEVLARLAVGGMAELFLAVVEGPGGFRKFVALKRILPRLREDAEFVAMFVDEARISAALSHANIAQVFDLGEEADHLYLVMEFIAGEDLSQIRKTAERQHREIPVGFTCRVMRDACLALHYAHNYVDAAGMPLAIIHRDLSPRNVMVSYIGQVKIVDFGVAKAKGLVERTLRGELKGSLGYMSPEQIRGEELDARADLFAAGVIMHELLSHKRLFNVRGNEAETLGRSLELEVEPPHERNAKVPREVSDVVLRALARDKSARFASGREMAQAIEAAAGPLLFDDERTAAYMRDLFPERIVRTNQLLGLAAMRDESDEPRTETGSANRAVPTGTITAGEPLITPGPNSKPPASAPALTWSGPKPSGAPTPENPPVILAVDDSLVGRKLVEAHLSAAGFQVLTCGSPAEALEVLAEIRPNLILLDVMMEGMNGFDLCRRIRETYPWPTPIVFVSAACSLAERTTGLSVGADDFLRKPYDPHDLVARVRSCLRRATLNRTTDAPAAGS